MEYRRCVLPWPYLRPYFECITESENNLQVQCKLCLPKEKYLSVGKSSNSNLRKHVRSIHPSHVYEMDGHYDWSPSRKRRRFSDILFRTNKAFRMYAESQGEYIALPTAEYSIPPMPATPPEDTTLPLRLSEVRSLVAPPTPQTQPESSTQMKKEDIDTPMQQKSCHTTNISPTSTTTVVSSTPPCLTYSERVSEDPPIVPHRPEFSHHLSASHTEEMPQLIRAAPQPAVPAPPPSQLGHPRTREAYNGPRNRMATSWITPSPADRKAKAELEIVFAQRRKVEAELRKLEADEHKVVAETMLLAEELKRCEAEKKKFKAEAEFFLREKAKSEEETRKAAAKAALLLEHKNFYLEQQKTDMVRRKMLLLEMKKLKQDLKLLH